MKDTRTRPALDLVEPPRLAELLPGYRAALVALGRRTGIDDYVRQIELFALWLGPERSMLPIALDRLTILEYRDAMGRRWGPSTISQALSAIRSFAGWCVERRHLEADPTIGIKHPKRPRPLPRALAPAEIAVLLASIAVPDDLNDDQLWRWQRDRRAVHLMLYAGLRRMEVAALLWRDARGGQITVRAGKGGKDRVVPTHAVLQAELDRAGANKPHWYVCGKRDGGRLAVKSIGHVFERWLPELLPPELHISAHMLRHTFATELRRAGAEIEDIQELLGHDDIQTTMIYVKRDAGRLRGAVDRLPEHY